jgi:Ni/Fe-hydrogenase subunit HybB-like protein
VSERALGGPFITRTTVTAAILVAILGCLLLLRFVFGLGLVSNMNNGYPWGLWLAYDVAAGTAIGCGGYALALVVYVLNRGQYHPLMRPAILASMFSYALGGFSVMVDISRWWNAWHIFWPAYFNYTSVMLEVALCIGTYSTILILEFAPAALERLAQWTQIRGGTPHECVLKLKKVLNKVLFVLIALGMTLPTMHQSSLGTMLVPFGNSLNPLWQTPMLPALFLLTALGTGYAVVMFEATLVSDRFHRPTEAPILSTLSRYMVGVIAAFLVLRWVDLLLRGNIGALYYAGALILAFAAENALFVMAMIILSKPNRRMAPRYQFIAAVSILAGSVLYRIDCYLIAYGRPGWHYFPSAPELLITFGMIAVEVLGYTLAVKFFPILHDTGALKHSFQTVDEERAVLVSS